LEPYAIFSVTLVEKKKGLLRVIMESVISLKQCLSDIGLSFPNLVTHVLVEIWWILSDQMKIDGMNIHLNGHVLDSLAFVSGLPA